ncbi:hypothetical protein V2J09_012633 [Rumex salicifolius]
MSRQIILAVALTITILLPTLPSSSGDTQLIIDTCRKIAQAEPSLGGNYQICVDFLNSDPRSVTSTLEGLGEISFELAEKKTVAIEWRIKSLLADPKVGPDVKKVLADCADEYDEAEESVGKALTAIKEKDFSGANTFTSAALDAPGNCEDGFKGGVASPLTKVNDEIEKFYGINLVFTNLLKN